MRRIQFFVVDGDAGLLNLLKMRLESAGHTVDIAENGWGGLAKIEHADYDLVLLDYMMPRMTGLTVLQHTQERHLSIPVVMMTSHTKSQVAAGARAGRSPYRAHPGPVVRYRNGCINAAVEQHVRKPHGSRERTKSREQSMMEPQNHDLSDVSEASVGLVNSDEGREALCRQPAGLTITVTKIDRLLADVQLQIERLCRERTESPTRQGPIGQHGIPVGGRMNRAPSQRSYQFTKTEHS
ncbi:MAG: response regulator [Nitrospiraceae bacterium]